MPTVLKVRGYRFFFYINDHHPPHIHVERERSTAKFLLENAELVKLKKFNASELCESLSIKSADCVTLALKMVIYEQ